MVYDLDRHYVGDLHYRNDDDFAEGLELRLDSGVVVQVQDLLGQTLTPLDQVLCSKNKATAGANALRPIPAVSHQRPRSLKDVLAASQSASSRPRAHVLPIDRQRPRPSDLPPRKKLKPNVSAGPASPQTAKDTTASLPFRDVVDLSSEDEPRQVAIAHAQSPLVSATTEATPQIDVQNGVGPGTEVTISFAAPC
ncbi:hypothetical protein DV735_g4484, partial [Chaetothyriales sp. CBS 134920]